MPVKPERTPLAEERAGHATALIVIDMFSGWDFRDADALAPAAQAIAPTIRRLKDRCARAGVPTVYVNDNQGRWRSDAPGLVRDSARVSSIGAAIASDIAPSADDYFALKPKHSAFFATPLDLLLRHLRVERLLVTGVASDQCVLLAAVEARMQDYDVFVPSDGVAAQSASRSDTALAHMKRAHGVATGRARAIRLGTGVAAATDPD
jgi:nicotinamidase-related amidase